MNVNQKKVKKLGHKWLGQGEVKRGCVPINSAEEAGFLSRLDINCRPFFHNDTQHAIQCTNNTRFLSVLPHYGHYCPLHHKILQSFQAKLIAGSEIDGPTLHRRIGWFTCNHLHN
jgi:hypothetical protein